jgi:hypothetical protein
MGQQPSPDAVKVTGKSDEISRCKPHKSRRCRNEANKLLLATSFHALGSRPSFFIQLSLRSYRDEWNGSRKANTFTFEKRPNQTASPSTFLLRLMSNNQPQ